MRDTSPSRIRLIILCHLVASIVSHVCLTARKISRCANVTRYYRIRGKLLRAGVTSARWNRSVPRRSRTFVRGSSTRTIVLSSRRVSSRRDLRFADQDSPSPFQRCAPGENLTIFQGELAGLSREDVTTARMPVKDRRLR